MSNELTRLLQTRKRALIEVEDAEKELDSTALRLYEKKRKVEGIQNQIDRELDRIGRLGEASHDACTHEHGGPSFIP